MKTPLGPVQRVSLAPRYRDYLRELGRTAFRARFGRIFGPIALLAPFLEVGFSLRVGATRTSTGQSAMIALSYDIDRIELSDRER